MGGEYEKGEVEEEDEREREAKEEKTGKSHQDK